MQVQCLKERVSASDAVAVAVSDAAVAVAIAADAMLLDGWVVPPTVSVETLSVNCWRRWD